MKLNQKQKRYISHIVEFVSDIKTWEDFGVEGITAIQMMGNSSLVQFDTYYKNAINNYIEKVRKDLEQ